MPGTSNYIILLVTNAKLEIYDGYAAFAVETPGHCNNALRFVRDLQPQMT